MFRSFGIVVFFHVGISGVDDGLGEVNHGVLLMPVADDLVLLLDVDKLVAPDETGECSRTSDGPTIVVDENLVPHVYLGDGDPLVPVRRRMDGHKV